MDVEAHMGSVVAALVAANPGDWLFHCHKPLHMAGGMTTLTQVG